MGQLTSAISTRFAPYADELRDCASSRRIPNGKPADLSGFVQQVSAPGRIRAEFSSLIRATIFREQEEIQPEEIVALIGFAIGGPEADLSRPELAAVQRELRTFVGEVFRSLWARFPAQEAPAAAPAIGLDEPHPVSRAAPAFEREEITVDNRDLSLRELAPSGMAEGQPAARRPTQRAIPHLHLDLQGMAGSSEQPWYEVGASHEFVTESDARSVPEPELRFRAEEPETHRGLFATLRSMWRDPEPEVTEEGEYPQYSSLELSQPERRRYLLLGAGGLLFGAALGTFLWRTPASEPTAAPIRSAALSPAPVSPIPAMEGDAAPAEAPLVAGTSDRLGADPSVGAFLPSTRAGQRGRVVTNRDWDRALGLARSPAAASPVAEDAATDLSAEPRTTAPAAPAAAPGRHFSPPIVSPEPAPVNVAPLANAPVTPGRGGRVLMNGGSIYLSVAGPMAANLLSAPVPQYPPSARAAGVQGEVLVQAVVGLSGDVVATRVLSGPAPLRDAAQNAVHRWRFIPYLIGGRPSMFTTEAVVDFRRSRE